MHPPAPPRSSTRLQRTDRCGHRGAPEEDKSVAAGKTDRAQLKQTAANLYQQLRASQAQQYQVMQQAGVQPRWYPRGMGPNSASYDPEEGR